MNEKTCILNEIITTGIYLIILNYKKQLELIKICASPEIFVSENHILNETYNVKITAELTDTMIADWYNLQNIRYNERKIYKHLRNMFSWWIYTRFKHNTNTEISLALDTLHHCVNRYPQMIWSFGNHHDIELSLKPTVTLNNDGKLTTQELIIEKFQKIIAKIKQDFCTRHDKSTVAAMIQYFFLTDTSTYEFLLTK